MNIVFATTQDLANHTIILQITIPYERIMDMELIEKGDGPIKLLEFLLEEAKKLQEKNNG
jgi:hypothetical protein